MRTPSLLLLLGAGLASFPGGPATPAARAATLLLRNAVLHPVTQPALTNASLLVRDGRIAALGASATLPDSADATLDLGGRHLFPGLIAPNTVLGLVEIDGVRATRDTTEVGEYTPDVQAWVAVNPDSELIPVARANGYTHAEAVPQGGIVSGHSSVVTLVPGSVEQVTFRRTTALHVFWPSFTLDLTPKERLANADQWKSPEDQGKDRERRLREIDDFFTEAEAYAAARAAAGLPASPLTAPGEARPRPSVADLKGLTPVPAWEAMLPALRREVPVVVHADEFRQIRSAVEWALRRKLRLALAGGRDAGRLAGLLASNHVAVAYEHVFTAPPRDTDRYDVQFAAPAALVQAGVEVSFAGGLSRFGASNVRNIPYAAAQAVAFGLSPDDALRGLTLHPARWLGMADRLGSLEVGKDATFFTATGDILDPRTQVLRLWVGGTEVPLESRHTRLYERYSRRDRVKAGP